jgi:hypothetical protein
MFSTELRRVDSHEARNFDGRRNLVWAATLRELPFFERGDARAIERSELNRLLIHESNDAYALS